MDWKDIIENSEEIEDNKKENGILENPVEKSIVGESISETKEILEEEIKDKHIISEDLIKKRKEKITNLFKTKSIWVIIFLIIAIILGVYIRSMPMHNHGGNPGLWDITTNTWTLGPDLDPWLFYRYAKTIVEEGSLFRIDMMRNIPLGFDTTIESKLLPYMIVWTHSVLNIFFNVSVIYSAAIFPVIKYYCLNFNIFYDSYSCVFITNNCRNS